MVKKPQKTAQRAAIMAYLEKKKSHPTIMDIYNAVSKKLSTISITTVYNTMNLLKEEGHVRELPAVFGHGVRFDPDTTPHHHLICNVCSSFIDVDLKDIHYSMFLSEEQRQGFDIQQVSIKIYGVCSQCKNKNINRMTMANG
jgi:Fur family transcriptional regulator, peroxide stress response regulator